MLGPHIVLVCDFLAMAYLVVLVYRSRKFRIRAGEIKFYYGVGPVLIPIDVTGGGKGEALGTRKVSER